MYFWIVKESSVPRRTYLAIHQPAVAILYWSAIANHARFQGGWLKAASRGQFDPASSELPSPPRGGSGRCRSVTNDTEVGGRQLPLRPTLAPMSGPGFLSFRREDSFPHPVYASIAGPAVLSSGAGRRKQGSGPFRANDGDQRPLAQVPAVAVPTRGSVLACRPRGASDETCCRPRRQSGWLLVNVSADTDASAGTANKSL